MKRRSIRNFASQRLLRLVVCIVGILLIGFLLPRVVALLGVVSLYPFQVTQAWWQNTTMAVPALWREKLELQQEITDLKSELTTQADTSLSVQRLRDENQALRRILGATTSPRIAAAVIGRPGQLPYDVLQLDQGSAVGIAVGDPVYSSSEEVLGLVSRVYSQSALVTLFTSPDFTTSAYLSDANMMVTLSGLGGGVARIAVPQGVPLRQGALAYIPSIQPGVFGRVVHVENESTQPQQFGYIVPHVPYEHLRFVSVGSGTAVQTDEVAVATYIQEIIDTLTIDTVDLASTSATSSTSTLSEL